MHRHHSEMSVLPLRVAADVEDEGALLSQMCGEGAHTHLWCRLCSCLVESVAPEPAVTLEVDQREPTCSFVCGASVIRACEEEELSIIRNERARPRGEASVERNVDRASHVSSDECHGVARVHDERAVVENRGDLLSIDATWRLNVSDHGRAVAIDALHVREISWRLGLSLEDQADELVLVARGQPPVGDALVTKRR